jgi:hypothetical protein
VRRKTRHHFCGKAIHPLLQRLGADRSRVGDRRLGALNGTDGAEKGRNIERPFSPQQAQIAACRRGLLPEIGVLISRCGRTPG